MKLSAYNRVAYAFSYKNKRQIFTFVMLLVFSILTHAQDFGGYKSGNNTGVIGVFFNPATIADSRYRFDINVFSFNTYLGNNNARFNLKEIAHSVEVDNFKNQVFSKISGPSSGIVNVNILGPSVMFNVNNKTTLAITTRGRSFANVVDVDGELFNTITNNAQSGIYLPYSFTSENNMQLKVNAWTELGVSAARVLMNKGAHFLKGGITAKLLSGAANGYFNLKNISSTINENLAGNIYLSNTTGRIAGGFSGMSINDIKVSQLTRIGNTGFGGDLGLIYEYRPEMYTNATIGEANENKYKLKIGAALLDVGSMKYNKDRKRSGTYDIDVKDEERLYMKEFQDANVEDYNSLFLSKQQYFTPVNEGERNTYKVGLPTSLKLDVDYHFYKDFYAAVSGQFPVNKNDSYNNFFYSGFTFTPRYEGKKVGVYVPINYNNLTNFNAGLSLSWGPVFLGSGSILSAAIDDSKQADLYFGVRFGSLINGNKER